MSRITVLVSTCIVLAIASYPRRLPIGRRILGVLRISGALTDCSSNVLIYHESQQTELTGLPTKSDNCFHRIALNLARGFRQGVGAEGMHHLKKRESRNLFATVFYLEDKSKNLHS